MRGLGAPVAAALAAIAVVGCSHVLSGGARPASSALEVLPSEDELSAVVGNRLNTFDFQPFVGGPEIMPDGFRSDADASPIRCVGVTDTMTRVTYESAELVEAARQSYFSLNEGAQVSGADAAVVRFASPDAADARYRSFVEQWQGCDGQTVVKHLRGRTNQDVDAFVADVDVDGPLLSATVITRQGTDPAPSEYTRALAVRGATIVEVSLAVSNVGAAQSGSNGSAARAARLMLDKV